MTEQVTVATVTAAAAGATVTDRVMDAAGIMADTAADGNGF